MKILYFTATGNSLYIAKSLGGELYSIPKMIKEETFEFTDEKIGIVFPTYSISVPPIIQDFIKKAKFNCDYLFAIATYGVFDGGVTAHIKDFAKEYAKEFSYINSISMVDSWLPGFDMKKQIQKEPKKEIEKHLEIIKKDIESSKIRVPKPSIFRRLATGYMVKEGKKIPAKNVIRGNTRGTGIKTFFKVEESCVQCQICAKVCPVDNIEMDYENGKIKLSDKCICCFSCLNNCPTNSLHLKNEVSRDRFRNKNISLQEIIDSNN